MINYNGRKISVQTPVSKLLYKVIGISNDMRLCDDDDIYIHCTKVEKKKWRSNIIQNL